jgi:hypothetical protein
MITSWEKEMLGKSAKNANFDNVTTNGVKNTVMPQHERQEVVP